LQPKVIVCLGATAAQALLGRDFRVTQHRGEFLKSAACAICDGDGASLLYILRAPDEATRKEEMKRFINDLKKISKK
jgi:DNA polymerase